MVKKYGTELKSSVIKVGHVATPHQALLLSIAPEAAVITVEQQ